MNVLLICRTLDGCGGMETMIRTLLMGLNATLHQNASLLILNVSHKRARSLTWKESLPITEVHSSVPRFLLHYRYLFTVAEYVKKHRIDAVICADEHCVHIADLARRVFHLNFKLVSWMHFSLHTIKRTRLAWLKVADANIAISRPIASQLTSIDCKNVFTLFNCVTEKNYLLSDNAFSPESPQRKKAKFLYIGRLTFDGQKRIRFMLQGLSSLSFAWELHLVGAGDIARLKAYASDLGLTDKVIFHGWQKDPWAYIEETIGSVSCTLLTSAFEGMPMALIESISFGIPCISSDCQSGPADIIRNGENGYLFDTDSLPSFVEALEKIYIKGVALDSRQIQEQGKPFYSESYFGKINEILAGTET